MQLSISVYTLGLAIGQLLYGALADSIGRRPCLLIGLSLYTVASLGSSYAPTVEWLLLFRLFQALGGCSGLVLGRTIVKDISSRDNLMSRISTLNLIVIVGPGLAPLLGGLLTLSFGWSSIFFVLTAFGIVILTLSWQLLPETGQHLYKIQPKKILHKFGVLFESKGFIYFAIAGACITTSIYAFFAASPYIMQYNLQQTPENSAWYAGIIFLGYSVGNITTQRIYNQLGITKILMIGCSVSIIMSVSLLSLTLLNLLNTLTLVLGLLLYTIGSGMCASLSLTHMMTLHPHIAASASGLYGSLQMTAGALFSYLSGLHSNPALAALILMSLAAVIAFICFLLWT